jgi:mannonate dehydratase
MRFDLPDFVAFDLHILRLEYATKDFPEVFLAEAPLARR